MLWIGITGPIGSGKSTVSSTLRRLGFTVFDADEVVHRLLAPGSPTEVEVLREFGAGVRDARGHLDRRALGRLVFGDPALLARLEAILHPRVRADVNGARLQLAATGVAAAFYDVPLLFEKNMEQDFDRVLVVSAPEGLRRARVQARSKWTDAEFLERSARQLPAAEKERRASAVIRNDGDLNALEREVRATLARLHIPLPPATHA